jgi:riboflavin biosynthesis pyrimidine reductase
VVYWAPLLAGGPVRAVAGRGAARSSDAPRLERITCEKLGPDLCFTGEVVYPEAAQPRPRKR